MVSCTPNTPQTRIANNPDLYQQLTPNHQSLVQRGQISKGMNKKAVYLAWGDPSRSSKGSENGKLFEKWYYIRYTPYYTGGLYGGYGYGGRGYYGTSISRTTNYNSELEAEVKFHKGIVTSWENAR
ncbi:hypothetical protein [Rubritalea tangerina]